MPARNGSMLMGNWIYSQFGGHLSGNFVGDRFKPVFAFLEDRHCHHLGLARDLKTAQFFDRMVKLAIVVGHEGHHKLWMLCIDLQRTQRCDACLRIR